MSARPDDAIPQVIFETAEEHLCRNVPKASPTSTVGEIRRSLIGQRYDCATDVAVCENGRPVGLLTIEDLLAAQEDVLAREVMDLDPPVVSPGTDQEVAAWKAVQHGETSLAVVDDVGRFIGLIPPRRLLSVLLTEHHEDMARMSGLLKDSLSAKVSLQEPIVRRFAHRVPWLIVGLLGVIVVADVVAAFQTALQAHVILAFFLPGIVYLADAVGTQTETLVVRGLSVGIPIRRVVWQELLTGFLIGVGLGAASIPIVLWRWGRGDIVLILAASLMAASFAATLVAILVPWVLHRMGSDPAFGTGPLSTVLQDLFSILIYLEVATLALR
jgi:magnesium transporter